MDTQPNLYDYVMAQLDAKRVHQRTVAVESGVPFSTVTKVAQRKTKNPSWDTVSKLATYFQVRERKSLMGTATPETLQRQAA